MPERVASTSLLLATAALLAAPRDAREVLAARIGDAVLERNGLAWQGLRRCAHHRIGRVLLHACERATIPGLAAHYRWRKRRIAAWVDASVRDGAGQVLVLGAGFDALGAFLAATQPQLRVLEIDRAASVARKREVLAQLGALAPSLRLAGVELGDAGALRHALRALRRDVPTVVVAEGLLMYLAPEAVAALLRTLAAHFSAPLRFVGTAMQQGHDGRSGFVRQGVFVRHWLQHRGEPFRWGVDASAPAASLARLGFDVDAVADPCAADDPDPAPGEWVFRARLALRCVS